MYQIDRRGEGGKGVQKSFQVLGFKPKHLIFSSGYINMQVSQISVYKFGLSVCLFVCLFVYIQETSTRLNRSGPNVVLDLTL